MRFLGLDINWKKNKTNRDKAQEPEFVKEMPKNIGYVPASQNKRPVTTDWSTETAIREGLKVSSFIYACISKLMNSAGSVPWMVLTEDKAGRWIPDPLHPMSLIINSPNPFQTWSIQQKYTTQYLNLSGNQVFIKTRLGSGVAAELWIAKPDQIKPLQDSTNYISVYEYISSAGGKSYLPVEDIIHFQFPDPSNLFWGLSPLKSADTLSDTDVETIDFNRTAMANRGIPDLAFIWKSNEDGQLLSVPQYENARSQLAASILGKDYAKLPLVLSGNVDVKDFGRKVSEFDFINSQKWTGNRVCSVFGVHPALIGLSESAQYKMDTLRLVFWEDTMIPYLESLREGYQNAFNLEKGFEQPFKLVYDLTKIPALRAVLFAKIKAAKEAWTMGVPYNTLDEKMDIGFGPIMGGEVGYVQTTMTPNDLMLEELNPDTDE